MYAMYVIVALHDYIYLPLSEYFFAKNDKVDNNILNRSSLNLSRIKLRTIIFLDLSSTHVLFNAYPESANHDCNGCYLL